MSGGAAVAVVAARSENASFAGFRTRADAPASANLPDARSGGNPAILRSVGKNPTFGGL